MNLRDLLSTVIEILDLDVEPKQPDALAEAEQLALRLWLDERESFVSLPYRSRNYGDEFQHISLPIVVGRLWCNQGWSWSSGSIKHRRFSAAAIKQIEAQEAQAKRDKELASIADLAAAIIKRQER